ncbi:neutral/alkaline non-lysosomal ceramidase N-terminal domain-containing protein [Agriterribacter sp.]|uniref:neutral/alkaline non-lysosomal ceramidase N-terminal domain-containing protein n=1 Tax=Agriterribacter sp. TaxID=2821509 RepID=UPI002BD2EE0A|nr:neutral/alkaline non-lysosomal ceramidase N-terminal domain-containing protein [Agriterribacter sp.]HRO44222.1 neutral/alkaline non-lysosomal ceramidase N-terminal domain-containing protein [Agriterribacter sp.]HRQ18843.1 neutral/alkaline non-lysosomal ceramidase N-terminal domain-containing protein [Agriterribacter sp.]
MKKVFPFLIFFFTVAALTAQTGAPGRLLAGAAEAVINPPNESFLAGYDQNRRSTGVHDNLFVKAVVVANRLNALALVTIDCIGLPYPVVQQIRDAVELKLPPDVFNAEQIIVSSTHTHSGPDVIGIWGMDVAHTGTDSGYIRFLVKTTAEVIEKAWKRRQAAVAKYADTVFGEGWVENVSDSTEVDRSVSIMQFTTSGGKNIATLTNFACHPTFLGRENTLVSADFPSGFYKQMKKNAGGINLYVQGAIGGWVQPEKVARTFEEAEKKGAALATAVTGALKQAKKLEGTAISFASRRFEIPVNNNGFKQMTAAGIIKRDISDGTPTEIAWFTIGNAVFATHPGETSPLYAFATKQLMTNNGPKFIIGLGQDELGYILKPDFFEPGTRLHAAPYLTGMSPGEAAGAAMMQVLTELAERDGEQ